jgi:excinuclease ABC subunit B
LPEVSLVAILDADKEGYLRSARSLIQTIGRAARNVNGRVLMYADRITDSMQKALDETERRRVAQSAYNTAHGITPQTIQKAIGGSLVVACEGDYVTVPIRDGAPADAPVDPVALAKRVAALRGEMREAARQLEFERAATLRDEIRALEERLLGVPSPEATG